MAKSEFYRGIKREGPVKIVDAPIGKWIGSPKKVNPSYYATKCTEKGCSKVAIYRWRKRVFCRDHREECIKWIEKTRLHARAWLEDHIIAEANDQSVAEVKYVSY